MNDAVQDFIKEYKQLCFRHGLMFEGNDEEYGPMEGARIWISEFDTDRWPDFGDNTRLGKIEMQMEANREAFRREQEQRELLLERMAEQELDPSLLP